MLQLGSQLKQVLKNGIRSVAVLHLLPVVGFAQTIYKSDSSHVSFYSKTPIEAIEAHNHASTSLIEMASRSIRFQVPVIGFQFQIKLMQEHFNDGYLDPKQFPYAQFNGKLSDSLDLSIDTTYNVTATGTMKLHGVDRMGVYPGVFTCKDSIATLQTEFKIVLADHGIKIPGAVFDSVAKEVTVKVYFRYVPFRKEE